MSKSFMGIYSFIFLVKVCISENKSALFMCCIVNKIQSCLLYFYTYWHAKRNNLLNKSEYIQSVRVLSKKVHTYTLHALLQL